MAMNGGMGIVGSLLFFDIASEIKLSEGQVSDLVSD